MASPPRHLRRFLALAAVALLGLARSVTSPAIRAEEPPTTRADRSAPFVVVGYLPDYRLETVDPAVGRFVTDIVFFSIEPKPDGALDTSRLDAKAVAALRRFKALHKVRILIALGGWQRSRGFVPVAADANARARLSRNLAGLCLEHGFDGIDFDWEHPANRAQEDTYAALLGEVKRAFRPKGLLVTAALADWQDPGAKAYEAVDRIHVMAYDHEGGRHSTFAHAQADIASFLARGVPKEKLCLGLPFYGRGVRDPKVEMTYAEIVRRDAPARTLDEVGGVAFNNIATIERKTRFAREQGLGGVMIWELGQDAGGENSLLRAIRRASPN